MKKSFVICSIAVLFLSMVSCISYGLLCMPGYTTRCTLLQQTMEQSAETTDPNQAPDADPPASSVPKLWVAQGPTRTVTLGSRDPNTGYTFQLELTTQGAAIRKATLSEFNNRDYKDPQPLEVLAPVETGRGRESYSMANTGLIFSDYELKLPLDRLNFELIDSSGDRAEFQALIKDKNTGDDLLKITKTYTIEPGSYHMDIKVTLENLYDDSQEIRFNLAGPRGIGREGVRGDMRKVIGGFRNGEGNVVTRRLDIKDLKSDQIDKRRIVKEEAAFLWSAITSKYFAAILVPLPEINKPFCDWTYDRIGTYYNPDGLDNSGDETVSFELKIAPTKLSAAGRDNARRTYDFELYLGPKDKSLFDKNEHYKNLGFVQTIDFLTCCCPAAIISPLAFTILGFMKWTYQFIPNYGVIIMILVLLIRLCLHPLTKKSQVSMSKMGKLAPRVEQIKKKYANNKTEMNKQVMELYREQGASPIFGMLPMFVQMPIWIALYSAIYASIELRGAPFLPVWITDLSAPDALFRFEAFSLPLFGKLDSFNLLPIMMGVAFFLQQKLMPSQAAASTNPQMQQQQKMMKIMLPIMFPLILYKAPSGLNLYIMTSTFAGVMEQYVIRKHIREQEELEKQGKVPVTSKTGGKIKKKKPKPFYRM